MGKPRENVEMIDQMHEILKNVESALESLKNDNMSVKEACEINDLDYNTFRRVVFSTDWEARDTEKRKKIKEKFSEEIPCLHWTEVLFCSVFGFNRSPDAIAKMPSDVKETVEKAVSTLTEREEKVVRMYYEDNMTLEEIGKELRLTQERIRQILHKAIRKLQNPRRLCYLTFGDGYYVSKKQLHDDVYRNAVIEAQVKEANKLDLIIRNRKNLLDKFEVTEKETIAGDVGIEHLDLSVRSYNCLYRRGVRTINDLCNLTYEELKLTRNLGLKGFDDIMTAMDKYGLKLKENSK